MKLGEHRLKRGSPQTRAAEVLGKPDEPAMGFDPMVHLRKVDWEQATTYLTNQDGRATVADALTVWMQQQYLDSEKFTEGVSSGPAADQFKELGGSGGEVKIQAAIIEEISNAPRGDLVKEFLTRLAVREIFPQHHDPLTDTERLLMVDSLQLNRNLGNTDKVIDILYLFKRFPGSLPDKVKSDPISYDLHVTPSEFGDVQDRWQEVWGTGQLEDVLPDHLVRMLAKIRVIDPELFEQMLLDNRFWSLALGWLEELRTTTDSKSVFDFSFHLYLLSAQEVRVNQEGKLIIENTKMRQTHPAPLPLRHVT